MFTDFYRCRPCDHEFQVDHKTFWVGPSPPETEPAFIRAEIDAYIAKHTQTFHCSACFLTLTIPSLAIRTDWLNWRDRYKAYYSRYPFVCGLVELIDSTYIGQPWRVAIHNIRCPYCSTHLARGVYEPSCPKCLSGDLKIIDQWHSQTRDVWPPEI